MRLAGEFVAERLEPEVAEMRRAVELGPGHEVHEAEAARVVVGDPGAVREVEDDVVVRRSRRRPHAWNSPGTRVRPPCVDYGSARSCRDA